MTFGTTERLIGTDRRDIIFIAPEDAEKLHLADGATVTVRSETGALNGIVRLASVKSGTLQAYWPEVNVLISRRAHPVSGEPDYNAEVWIEKS